MTLPQKRLFGISEQPLCQGIFGKYYPKGGDFQKSRLGLDSSLEGPFRFFAALELAEPLDNA